MSKSFVTKVKQAFWAGSWKSAMNYTREKDSQTSSEFWFLLIKAGFAFTKTDLVDNGAYCDEGHYSLAVRCGNLSFAYAYEYRHKRTPFIGTALSYSDCWPSFTNHATQSKSAGRLVIGTEFIWRGFDVRVTSFNDKKQSLVACAYHKRKGPDDYSDKIKKRFKITSEDFRKEMAVRKKMEKTKAALKEKGIKVLSAKEHGFYVTKKLKTKTKFYDTTGEVEGGHDVAKYKLFRCCGSAIKFAKTL